MKVVQFILGAASLVAGLCTIFGVIGGMMPWAWFSTENGKELVGFQLQCAAFAAVSFTALTILGLVSAVIDSAT